MLQSICVPTYSLCEHITSLSVIVTHYWLPPLCFSLPPEIKRKKLRGTEIEREERRGAKSQANMAPKDALPISQATTVTFQSNSPEHLNGLRRRIASFSVKIQPISTATTEWAFRRSQSMPSFKDITSGPLSKWWSWGTSWLISKKAQLSHDLEMSREGERATMLGRDGTSNVVMHLFYKIRSELRKLVGSDKLPTTHKFRYDSFSYAQNFDDGEKAQL